MFRQINTLGLALALGLLAAPAGADGPAPMPTSPRAITLGATSTPIAIATGQPVQFQDQSSGAPTSWSWDFSYDLAQPATDSTQQNPVWTFGQTGVYAVRLEVCNDGGCSAATHDVTVVEPCTLQSDLVLPEIAPALYDTAVTYEACHTITTSGVLSVSQPGDVTFRAGARISFGSGFSVGGGAHFKAIIDPTLNTP